MSFENQLYRIIKNPVLKVYWAGWMSDTYSLQQNGWQFSVEENVAMSSLRIALHHPQLKMYGLTKEIEHRYMEQWQDMQRYGGGTLPEVPLCYMASKLVVQIIDRGLNMFNPVDMTPQYLEMQIKSIEDFRIFRPLEGIQEIIVEPESVSELMEKILAMQSPKQKELREKARKERQRYGSGGADVIDFTKYKEIYDPKTDIIAQVVSIG